MARADLRPWPGSAGPAWLGGAGRSAGLACLLGLRVLLGPARPACPASLLPPPSVMSSYSLGCMGCPYLFVPSRVLRIGRAEHPARPGCATISGGLRECVTYGRHARDRDVDGSARIVLCAQHDVDRRAAKTRRAHLRHGNDRTDLCGGRVGEGMSWVILRGGCDWRRRMCGGVGR
jgi:hypothetical protein